ncbi:MAG: biotin/lipoyl-binding protein, partial [Paludibacteraceae bacterium]|nr:biotin/lipoyl-binding protein [Paludibacteraceae bacterium]
MDKIIEKKHGIALAFTIKALPYWFGAVLLSLIIYLLVRDNTSTMRINPDTLTIATVTKGDFNDYIRLNGQVLPMTTIQISPQEGGVVQKIIVEEGTQVKAGDPILLLSNDNLDLQILNSEAELAEKENILRNTLISMEQQKLNLQQEQLQLQTEVKRCLRIYE